MPVYHQEPENDSAENITRRPYQSFACGLLHFGPVALYSSQIYMDEDIAKLADEDFDIRNFHASAWKDKDSLHDDLVEQLNLPNYYGRNLHALDDCLRDIPIPDSGGLALAFRDYDQFFAYSPGQARGILDVLTSGSRLLQCFGKTLLVMIHTNDADFDRKLGPLGAISAQWNSRQFLRKDRED